MTDEEYCQSKGGTEPTWPPFHWLQNESCEPILNDFWAVKYDEHDVELYRNFIEMLRLRKEGLGYTAIAKHMGMSGNVDKYLLGLRKCFLTHMRAEHDRIGTPRQNFKWLPLRLKPRGTPDTAWIQVPLTTRDYQGISSVLKQLPPTTQSFTLSQPFGYGSEQELLANRENLFGFFLGAMVGDASKPTKGTSRFPSMTVSLTLSKRKPNSLRFGEFTSLCANASLGLNMHRIADLPSSKYRYTDAECYSWLTPASPILGWVVNVCLGLRDGERTTYNPVKIQWLSEAPRSFREHFIQGVAESDGWVDPGSNMVCLVASPNTELFSKILADLDTHPRVDEQPPVQIIRIPTEEAAKAQIFSARLGTQYFQDLRLMSTAIKLPERKRLPQNLIDQIRELAKTAKNYNKLSLELARTTGYKVNRATLKKYTRNQDSSPPSSFFFSMASSIARIISSIETDGSLERFGGRAVRAKKMVPYLAYAMREEKVSI